MTIACQILNSDLFKGNQPHVVSIGSNANGLSHSDPKLHGGTSGMAWLYADAQAGLC